jgi:hypothetical protein
MGTSTRIFMKPNRNAHTARKPIPDDRIWVWGRAASRSAISGPEILSARPVPPIFDGSTPATGMADKPPTAAAKSTIERRASVRPKSALISGIATAHAPMQRPLAKKIAVTPARARTTPFARAGSIVGDDAAATAIAAANDATSSGRACGACRETSVSAKASRFDRRKGHRSVQEIRSTAFRRRSWLTRLRRAGRR